MADGNVFISHIHEDDSRVGAMKDLLAEHGYNVRDSSITSDKPNEATSDAYIKNGILAPRIDWAGTLVVIVSPGMRNSAHVAWEIEYANRHNKRIVGVWAQGATNADAPEALNRYADAVVGWQGERIRDAIRGDINDWEKSGGDLQVREIARYSC